MKLAGMRQDGTPASAKRKSIETKALSGLAAASLELE
jgi:hypothetical protein